MSCHERKMYAHLSERHLTTTFTIDYSDKRDSFLCALVTNLAANPLALQYYHALRIVHYALSDVDAVRNVIRIAVGMQSIECASIEEDVLNCVIAAWRMFSVLEPRTAELMKEFGRDVIGSASLLSLIHI